MKDALPLFYFKPTLCWIDDDQLFLDAVNIAFQDHYHCRTFLGSKCALQFFSTYQPPLADNFLREFTESDLFNSKNHYPVDLDIPQIINLLNRPEKKEEVAVVVVDYNMPHMNGIEVCRQLAEYPCKKILLTGDASYEEAVRAFNQGWIDQFIRKDQGVADKLYLHIADLAQRYFYEKTKNVLSHLETTRLCLLSDEVFKVFFNQWCKENQIAEFYLMNKQGSFLVKDSQGKLSYFVVLSETDKLEFLKLYDDLPEDLYSLLDQVKAGNKIPFFGLEKESWQFDFKEWPTHFYPAELIKGRENYYWTVVG